MTTIDIISKAQLSVQLAINVLLEIQHYKQGFVIVRLALLINIVAMQRDFLKHVSLLGHKTIILPLKGSVLEGIL